jgi:MFS transporter, Spinster family, sphingosine-1-phosphate transporter
LQPTTSSVSSRTRALTPGVIWGTVALLWITYLLNYVDRQVVFSMFPVLKTDLGFSDTQLGLIGSVFTWVYSLCMVLSGRAADLFRRDRLIIGSLLLWSVATLGTSASHSVSSFLSWRAVMGITESVYVPAALSLIASLHGPATRSRALGIHMTAQITGIAVGGWYGGWAADHIGWRSGFAVLAVVGIVYAVVLVLSFRAIPETKSDRESKPASAAQVFDSICYNGLLLAFFAYCVMLWMIYAWLPTFIYEHYHLSMTESGLTATIYLQGSTAIGVLTGAFVADRAVVRLRAARFYLVAGGVLLSAPFAWLAFQSDSLAVLKLASVGFGFFGGWLMANIFAAAYDVIARENYGLGAGALNLCGGLAGGTAIFIAGYLKASVGIAPLMLAASAVSVASGILLIVITRFRFPDQDASATAYAN